MKITKTFLFICILFALAACSDNKDIDWQSTKDEAIKDGIKKEEISKDDILDELDVDGNTFVVYHKGGSLGVAQIVIDNENDKYAWYRTSPTTTINKAQASWEFETESEETYVMYAGQTPLNDSNTIETVDGPNTPIINEKMGVYYYISKK